MIDSVEREWRELEDAVGVFLDFMTRQSGEDPASLIAENPRLGHLLAPLLEGTSGHEPWSASDDDSVKAEEAPSLPLGAPSADVQGASRPRSRFGNYRIVREIGRGGMGVVFEAIQESLGRRIALKIMIGSRFASAEGLVASNRFRFLREAVTAAKVDAPGICRVYETGMVEGQPFIAMEYVEGETLAQQLDRALDEEPAAAGGALRVDSGQQSEVAATDTPPPGASDARTTSRTRSREDLFGAVQLIESVARSIHRAHEAGVVHRDLKPSNIMISRTGEPTILDFGLAFDALDEMCGHVTEPGARLGTPCYMSPEQVEGHIDSIDRRSDVFSLGVILYEVLTMERPFTAKTREGLYKRILEAQPVDPRRHNRLISPDLNAVCLKALQRRRGRRYQTAEEFADDLNRVCRHETTVARPLTTIARLWRYGCRKHWQVAAMLLVIALVLTGLYMKGDQADALDEAARLANAAMTYLDSLQKGEEPDPESRLLLIPYFAPEELEGVKQDPARLKPLVLEKIKQLRGTGKRHFIVPRGTLAGDNLTFRFRADAPEGYRYELIILDEEMDDLVRYEIAEDHPRKEGIIDYALPANSPVRVSEASPRTYFWKIRSRPGEDSVRAPRGGTPPPRAEFTLVTAAFRQCVVDRVKQTGRAETDHLLRAAALLRHEFAIDALAELGAVGDGATASECRLREVLRSNAYVLLEDHVAARRHRQMAFPENDR